MKKCLGIDEVPPWLEQYFKATTKLQYELSADIKMECVLVMELSSLVEDIHVKAREASQNVDLDMQDLFEINEVLQSIFGLW